MIINIHGFGGKGTNTKYIWLRTVYAEEEIYHKTFDYSRESPAVIFSHYAAKVEEGLARGEQVKIIGTSWGGFFAYCLNARYPESPTILFNPSLNPHLSKRILDVDLDILRAYTPLMGQYMLRHSDKCHVIVGEQDEVINHKYLTLPMFSPANIHAFHLGHDFDIACEEGPQSLVVRIFKDSGDRK